MKTSQPETIFIADRMLGRLARYLRLMGYDVSYPPPCTDTRLISMARSESRVLLTRDLGIICRESALINNPAVVKISSSEVLAQLAQLAEEGWITIVHSPRCSICNNPLEKLEEHFARHLLPPFTLTTHNSFLFCSSCNIVFWEGSHWEHFQDRVSRIFSFHR